MIVPILAISFAILLLPSRCLPIPAPTISRLPFDCRRIHPAFCCSSRVRQNCAQLCLNPSSPPCIPPPFSPIQGPIPPQLPTSFGGSIDQTNLNVPGPPPVFWPPDPGRRRFTTEGRIPSGWNGPEQNAKFPQPQSNLAPQPFFPPPPTPPPPSPPHFGLILPPPDAPTARGTPVPIEDLDMVQPNPNQDGQPHSFGQTEVEPALPAEGEFPTLIPNVEPSIDESAIEQFGEKKEGERGGGELKVTRTEGGAMDGMAGARQGNGKTRRGGGTALKPAHLMRELEELEGGGGGERAAGGWEGRQQAAANNMTAANHQWWAPIRLSLVEQKEGGRREEEEGKEETGDEVGAGDDGFAEPNQPRTTVTELGPPLGGPTEMPPRTFSQFAPIPANQLWSFRIKPSGGLAEKGEENGGQKRPDLGGEVIKEAGENRGEAGENRGEGEGGGLFGERIDVLVDKVFNNQFLGSIATITNKNYSANHGKASAQVVPPTNHQTAPPPPLPPPVPMEQCGIAPQFLPCLPLDQANARLQSCCQKRQMPAGCLPLCRYDTTQAEVKMAFDKAQCGILNVTPFLECASQDQNNLECCRHREIAKKSGSQCEVFCTGEKIGLLGLQHLVCSTQIQSILQCHHSGLKQ